MRTTRRAVSIVAVCLVTAACSPTDAADESTTTTTPITTTLGTPTTSELPGEVIDFGPRAGDDLMVIGVAHDDYLNLRTAPGPEQVILDTLEPTHSGLIARGETRQLPEGFWVAVDHHGVHGWVHLSYIGFEGVTEDWTASVVEDMGGFPAAETVTELGFVIAVSLASEEPESDIVLVVDESVADLGEVTYDVIGLGDDAVRGFRVHVFGQPDNGGFSLQAVEVTALCGRGVTSDGLCT